MNSTSDTPAVISTCLTNPKTSLYLWLFCHHHSCFITIQTLKPSSYARASSTSPALLQFSLPPFSIPAPPLTALFIELCMLHHLPLISLSPFLPFSSALVLSFPVEVGHWVDSEALNMMSLVKWQSDWAAERSKRQRLAGRRGDETKGWRWKKIGWSKINLQAGIVLSSERREMESGFMGI